MEWQFCKTEIGSQAIIPLILELSDVLQRCHWKIISNNQIGKITLNFIGRIYFIFISFFPKQESIRLRKVNSSEGLDSFCGWFFIELIFKGCLISKPQFLCVCLYVKWFINCHVSPQINLKTVPHNSQSLIFNRNNWKGTRVFLRALTVPLQEHHFLNQVNKTTEWEIGSGDIIFQGNKQIPGNIWSILCDLQKQEELYKMSFSTKSSCLPATF